MHNSYNDFVGLQFKYLVNKKYVMFVVGSNSNHTLLPN